MFKSKNKEKKEKNISISASSSYNESTQVQTSNTGGLSSTVFTRQTSSQSSHKTTEERTFTVHHSSSAGNVPQLMSINSARLSLQNDSTPWTLGTDSTPWTLGTGSATKSPLLTSNSRLPAASTFGTTSNFNQPRSSLPMGSSRAPAISASAMPYRTTLNSNTYGSYPSRSRPSPLLTTLGQTSAQNAGIATSLPGRNEDIIPTYSNICSKRGKALVINNIKFLDKKDERFGAKKDSNDLTKFLKDIGFDVDLKEDMKGKDMLKKVEHFSKTSFFNHDISIVVIMSHGNNIVQDGNKLSRVKGGYTEIVGIDNVPLLVDDVVEKFTSSSCHHSLKGKPKIFIFQCCRGDKDQEVCHDAAPINKVLKDHSDMLLGFSTLPGYLSNRDPKTGSWYIQSICEVFRRHYKDFHIEEMLKIVDDQLSKRHPLYTQTSTYECRGFKRCYLHPR